MGDRRCWITFSGNRRALAYFQGIEVHNETLGDELVGYGKTRHEAGSFHAPLVAEFELP